MVAAWRYCVAVAGLAARGARADEAEEDDDEAYWESHLIADPEQVRCNVQRPSPARTVCPTSVT